MVKMTETRTLALKNENLKVPKIYNLKGALHTGNEFSVGARASESLHDAHLQVFVYITFCRRLDGWARSA